MNIYLLVAAVLASITCVGHFVIAKPQLLCSKLQADFDPTAITLMHCVFHYVSIFLVLSTLVLFACGLQWVPRMQTYALALFISLNFMLFAIWQIYIGYFAEAKSVRRVQFHWVFFIIISVFTLLGVFTG